MRSYSLKNPVRCAEEFLFSFYRDEETGIGTLVHWNGDFYEFENYKFVPVSVEKLRSNIYAGLQELEDERGKPLIPKKYDIENVMDALKAIIFTEELSLPSWRAPRPQHKPKDIIPFTNGLFHIPTKTLLPNSCYFFSTHAIEVDYTENPAKPESWLRFLDSIWGDDIESIQCLQEWFGLLLTQETKYQKSLLIVGPKRSGKGTIGRVLQMLVGSQNSCNPTLSSIGREFGLENLITKSMAIISDARLGGRADFSNIAENILRITGEDSISVCRKYKTNWNGKLFVRFLIFTNEVPAVADSSGAFASRFITLKMIKSFYGEENLSLDDDLKKDLPGIVQWAIQGLDRLNARGKLIQPVSSAETQLQLESLSSPIKLFVKDECIIEPKSSIQCVDLFEKYKIWCKEQNQEFGSAQIFGKNLVAAFPHISTIQRRVKEKMPRFYVGIQLNFSDSPKM